MGGDSEPVTALGELVRLGSEKAAGHKRLDWPYVGLEHLEGESPLLTGTAHSSVSTSTNSIFRTGDVLFGKLRPYLRKSVAAPFSGYCSTDLLVLTPNEGVNPAFAAKVFQSQQVFARAIATSVGTKMPRTSWGSLKNLEVFVPPLTEQRRIAEILDTLDEGIRKTEQVIAKLQQMKQGLLHDLLTRGIDEHGELRDPERHPEQFKDSLLGRIPRGWAACPVGELAFLQNGYSFKEHELDDTGLRIVRISNLKKPAFPYWHYAGIPRPKLLIRQGDLLFTWAGVATSIDVFLYDGPDALLNQHIYNFKMADDGLRKWTYHCITVQLPEIRRMIEGGAGQLHLTRSQVAGITVPVPPDVERAALLGMMETQRSRVAAERRELVKLRTLKHGLMDDLLTGRVRVPVSEEASV
jgi:type I restriction enzyme, S subunit